MNVTDLEFNRNALYVITAIEKEHDYFTLDAYVFTKKDTELSLAELRFSIIRAESRWSFFETSTGDTTKSEIDYFLKKLFEMVIK